MAVDVPESWVHEVVKSAALVAAGRATASAIPPKTTALMEGVLRAMLLSKAKSLTAVLLVVSLSALACVVWARGQVKSEGEKVETAENKKEANRPAEDDRIRSGDRLHIAAADVLPDVPINGVFRVERRGTVALGIAYGRVQVKGQTLEEAEATILRYLQKNVVEKATAVLITRYDPVADEKGQTLEKRVQILEEEMAALRAEVQRLQR
jgi:hypothetical protein